MHILLWTHRIFFIWLRLTSFMIDQSLRKWCKRGLRTLSPWEGTSPVVECSLSCESIGVFLLRVSVTRWWLKLWNEASVSAKVIFSNWYNSFYLPSMVPFDYQFSTSFSSWLTVAVWGDNLLRTTRREDREISTLSVLKKSEFPMLKSLSLDRTAGETLFAWITLLYLTRGKKDKSKKYEES